MRRSMPRLIPIWNRIRSWSMQRCGVQCVGVGWSACGPNPPHKSLESSPWPGWEIRIAFGPLCRQKPDHFWSTSPVGMLLSRQNDLKLPNLRSNVQNVVHLSYKYPLLYCSFTFFYDMCRTDDQSEGRLNWYVARLNWRPNWYVACDCFFFGTFIYSIA